MWNLDDTAKYVKFASLELDSASTWGTPEDKAKREKIRKKAKEDLPSVPVNVTWAFRIYVKKTGSNPFDIENVLKIIIDSFSIRQINRDWSEYTSVGLYPDDTVDHVNQIQVAGERTAEKNSTEIHIFYALSHA